MKRYKEPGFQERISAAARARSDALAQMQARPQKPELTDSERKAARDARDPTRKNRTA